MKRVKKIHYRLYKYLFASPLSVDNEDQVQSCKKLHISRRLFEFACGSVIFILTILALLMRTFISASNPAVFEDYGDHYLVYWFPLFVFMMLFVVATFFLIKAWCFRSCIYTKIISTAFFIAKTLSLLQVIILIDWNFYILAWDFNMYIGVLLTSGVWFIRYVVKLIRMMKNNGDLG